eukprot:COSAG01_NODE_17025_length_1184_cov_1.262673_2_plen_49_part_01
MGMDSISIAEERRVSDLIKVRQSPSAEVDRQRRENEDSTRDRSELLGIS